MGLSVHADRETERATTPYTTLDLLSRSLATSSFYTVAHVHHVRRCSCIMHTPESCHSLLSHALIHGSCSIMVMLMGFTFVWFVHMARGLSHAMPDRGCADTGCGVTHILHAYMHMHMHMHMPHAHARPRHRRSRQAYYYYAFVRRVESSTAPPSPRLTHAPLEAACARAGALRVRASAQA